jgi:hypothetical protein
MPIKRSFRMSSILKRRVQAAPKQQDEPAFRAGSLDLEPGQQRDHVALVSRFCEPVACPAFPDTFRAGQAVKQKTGEER